MTYDSDLLDVTLATDTSARGAQFAATSARQTGPHSRQGNRSSPDDTTASDAVTPPTELVHTTDNHPWLTADRGWLPAGELRVGEQVVRLDGSTATVGIGPHCQ